MKELNQEQRDRLYEKRKFHHLSLEGLAILINCKTEHMAAAQIGNSIPNDIHSVLVDWVEN